MTLVWPTTSVKLKNTKSKFSVRAISYPLAGRRIINHNLDYILQITKEDGLPDTICLTCKNNLELFCRFRKICIQSEKTLKLRLSKGLGIRKEDTSLNKVPWLEVNDTKSLPNIDNDIIECKSSSSEENEAKPIARLINKNIGKEESVKLFRSFSSINY